ncbi:MAG TPA: hypothetical protein VMS94_00380 [Acidobacteriota bacterium]|nr:hypothetical protein [Acidobacteriota bacterium]
MNTYISNIHEKYFELLHDYFGSIYRTSPSKDPHKAGVHFANLGLSGKILHDVFPDLRVALMKLWAANAKNLYATIKDLPGLKTCYSGDISPSECFDLISRTGLYIDTTLIPDPLMKLLNIPTEMIRERHLVYYVVKHTFNILNSQQFFQSDTEVPISVIYPLEFYFDERRRRRCVEEAYSDTRDYFEELFGKTIKNDAELDDILNQDLKTLASKIKRPQILVPYLQDVDNISKGLEEGAKEISTVGVLPVEGKSAGSCLKIYVNGKLLGLSDCLVDCVSFDAKPLFDAPRSWSMLRWKLQKDTLRTVGRIGIDPSTAVINALQLDNFEWLGNVPLDKLVLMRKNNEMQELRELLKNEVSEIHECNRGELEIVAKRVQSNLTRAFENHEKEIRDIENEYKKSYRVAGSLITTGTIASIAGLFWPPAALALILGGGGLIDLKKIYTDHKEKILEMTNRPVGIMFAAKQRAESL